MSFHPDGRLPFLVMAVPSRPSTGKASLSSGIAPCTLGAGVRGRRPLQGALSQDGEMDVQLLEQKCLQIPIITSKQAALGIGSCQFSGRIELGFLLVWETPGD